MLGLCVEYISSAVVGPSFSAYIADESDESQRGRVFGLTQSLFMVVSVVGPAMGGLLAYRFSFRPMLLVAFALYASATVLRIWMALAEQFAPTKKAEKPTLSSLKAELVAMFSLLFAGGILTWIWVTDAVGDTAFNLIGQLYPIYLAEIGKMNVAQIGFLNSAWGVATILSSFLAGWLVDRRSERQVIVAGFVVEALGIVVFLQAADFFTFLAAMFIFGLGAGSLMPAYQSLISKAVPEGRRGLAYGFFGTSLGILSLPFPWIGAQLWERVGPQAPFWITVAACLISIPIAWFKFILPKEEAEPA
jgi:DHA1 family multidrug resistance protein-like MFS transporter